MSYTCNSCKLAFTTSVDQREHMRSEWHRYNLKRRVAQLPPIDEELFNNKVASMSTTEDDNKAFNSFEKSPKRLARRREKEKILEQKRDILARAREAIIKDKEKEESDSRTNNDSTDLKEHFNSSNAVEDEEALIKEKLLKKVDIPLTTCLFCHSTKKANFRDLDSNIKHMFSAHGLYIPESKYLTDKEGLIAYFGEKIGLGNVCLSCSYQGRDINAVREHMLSKRHMRIPYETEDQKLEISEFYDFSSTYDAEDLKFAEEENEDWEDVSGDESDDEVLTSKENTIYEGENELILPSGVTIGHRSLARYYKQNLPPERILSEGQGTVIAAETRHILGNRDKKEVAQQKRAWDRQKKREDINDRRAAKFINNQPHYRDQLLQ